MTLKELAFVCHVSLKDLVGSMRIRHFEVMQAALQSPRSAHAVCCCQAGSISASRLRATGKGRMCRYPKGTQATAIPCTRARYRARRSAQRAPQITLETNMQRFARGEGPTKAKGCSFRHHRQLLGCSRQLCRICAHPSFARDHEATRPHLPRSPGTARAALPM